MGPMCNIHLSSQGFQLMGHFKHSRYCMGAPTSYIEDGRGYYGYQGSGSSGYASSSF